MQGGQGSLASGATGADGGAAGARLRGWKEIGRHFGVDERTAKRWEATRGLPVHRVPGESRASVFAFAGELAAWEARGRQGVAAPTPPDLAPARRPWLALALLLLALLAAIALWLGTRLAEERREAAARTADATRLAAGQLAALHDQLDSPPGTVAVRASLAAEATRVLGAVASGPARPPALRREAAEGWRRLAILQNAVDRPSLRDRDAALAALDRGLALLDGDDSAEAGPLRARLRIEAARQAVGGGALAEAEALLAEAKAAALADRHGALAEEWWLARAETASWAGDHDGAIAAARRASVSAVASEDPQRLLRRLKARDLEAEALYYRGDLGAAKARYLETLALAEAAFRRWPADSRIRWALLRQQWNLGSTLVALGEPRAAVPLTAAALAGWQALAAADPSDEAVAAWVRAVRLSHGQALASAGQRSAAIAVLSDVAAERRQWLAARPGDADRRRMLMKGLGALGDTLARAGRTAEACALYAEAQAAGDAMAADGQLTGHDRDETLRLLAAAAARHCQSTLPGAAATF